MDGNSGQLDEIRDALSRHLQENKMACVIDKAEALENEGYIINVRVKDLEQHAGSGNLYNKLYDIILEKGTGQTIILNLEPM